MTLSYFVARGFLRHSLRLWNGLVVEGRERVPARGPFLIVSNHLSYLDPPVIGCGLRREVRFLARRSLYDVPLFGRAIGLWTIPIEPSQPDRAAIRGVLESLEEGWPVVVFPEGTRSADGETGPFRRGFTLIVRRAGVPVLPAAVLGTDRALGRGARLWRPATVGVRYGDAIPAREALALGADGLRERVRELTRVGD